MNFQFRVGCVDYTSYLVEKMGLKPMTPTVQMSCSSQLSYNPLKRYLFVFSNMIYSLFYKKLIVSILVHLFLSFLKKERSVWVTIPSDILRDRQADTPCIPMNRIES